MLGEASNAVILAFNVQTPSNTRLQADQSNVEIRSYNIIYQAVEDLKLAVEGLLKPDLVEEIVGEAIVKETFKIPKIGFIAGSQVESGTITRDSLIRLVREEEEISEGEIVSLKHIKDDAKEMKEGFECGIGVEGFTDFNEGDIIEVYEIKEVKRTLG